jgi:hypothetical protein
MKINSTLEKKLLKYSAMASGVIALGASANAQITYFDENPDVTFTGHQQGYAFDFDGDTNDDMTVATVTGSQTGSFSGYQYTLYYNAVLMIPGTGAAFASSSSGEVRAMSSGNAINSAGSFNSSQGTGAAVQSTYVVGYGSFGPYTNGAWSGASNMYLGFRFTSAGNLHYGWMRMDVDATAENVTIYDWAYNSTPDAGINAGQTVLSVASTPDELALVRFGNNRVDIKAINGSNGNVTIVGMDGKVAYNAAMNSTTESIDLSNFAAGLYVVNAQFSEGAVSHKVVVR